MAKVKSANEIASLFLVQMLEREKQSIQRSLDLLAEADEAEDEGVAEGLAKFALEDIRWVCIFGGIRRTISYKQWKWLHDVGKRHQGKLIVTFAGREVGFASYSWPTEPETSIHYILDPAFVQKYMNVPTDVLARAEALEPLTGDLPINQWMLHIEETKSAKSET